MADSCPETLEVTLEKLGEVKYSRMPGQPDSGRVKIEVTGPMPPGVPRPAPGSFEDYPNLTGGTPVFRRVQYTYDGDETRCDGPIEYHICFYKRTQDIISHGHIFAPTRDLGGRKEVKEISGICIEELLKMLFTAGLSEVPKLLAKTKSPAAGHDLELATLLQKDLQQLQWDKQSEVERRISCAAFTAMVQLMGDYLGAKVRLADPRCMEPGWAYLDDIASELRDLRIKHSQEFKELFVHLDTVRLRASEGTSPDEAWINETGWFVNHYLARK